MKNLFDSTNEDNFVRLINVFISIYVVQTHYGTYENKSEKPFIVNYSGQIPVLNEADTDNLKTLFSNLVNLNKTSSHVVNPGGQINMKIITSMENSLNNLINIEEVIILLYQEYASIFKNDTVANQYTKSKKRLADKSKSNHRQARKSKPIKRKSSKTF